jgi:hypothetical protein
MPGIREVRGGAESRWHRWFMTPLGPQKRALVLTIGLLLVGLSAFVDISDGMHPPTYEWLALGAGGIAAIALAISHVRARERSEERRRGRNP